MYKKVKNSSLMNWFWFIIYILPLLFLGLFAINFYRDDDINVYPNNLNYNYINLLSEYAYDITYDSSVFSFNEDDFSFEILDNSTSLTTSQKTLSFYLQDLNMANYNYNYCISCLEWGRENAEDSFQVTFYGNNNGSLGTKTFKFPYNSTTLNRASSNLFNGTYYSSWNGSRISIIINSSTHIGSKFSIALFDDLMYSSFYLSNGPSQDNIHYTYDLGNASGNDLSHYLQDNFYNTFSHNGILYNMFINLFSYFGVFNIYIQIISVYLEYIVLITLIHLAFDILLLLPNICHKFMERIGGERD